MSHCRAQSAVAHTIATKSPLPKIRRAPLRKRAPLLNIRKVVPALNITKIPCPDRRQQQEQQQLLTSASASAAATLACSPEARPPPPPFPPPRTRKGPPATTLSEENKARYRHQSSFVKFVKKRTEEQEKEKKKYRRPLSAFADLHIPGRFFGEWRAYPSPAAVFPRAFAPFLLLPPRAKTTTTVAVAAGLKTKTETKTKKAVTSTRAKGRIGAAAPSLPIKRTTTTTTTTIIDHEHPGSLFSRLMRSYVQVVSTPTADTPGAAVLLHFDNRRYLFGRVAEGSQRLMVQRKVALGRIEDLFVSGAVGWRCVGGLLGMVLTLADVTGSSQAQIRENNARRVREGKDPLSLGPGPSLNVHAGRNLTYVLAAARHFVFRKGMKLRLDEMRSAGSRGGQQEIDDNAAPDWEDGNIRVWRVLCEAPMPTSRQREEQEESPASMPCSPGAAKRKLDMISGGREADHKHKADSGRGNVDVDVEVEVDGESPATETGRERSASDLGLEITAGIVKNMFDSDWNLDVLRECQLHEVKLPAAIFVSDGKGTIVPYKGPLPGGPEPCEDIKVLVRRPWPSTAIRRLPRSSPSLDSTCYIVKCQPRRGKFNAARATALGVAKTDFKLLTDKQTVRGKDGAEVTPEMVLEPDVEGHGFAFIDVPRLANLDSFLARPEWSNPKIMAGIDVMYWVTDDKAVLRDPRLLAFMRAHASRRHEFLTEFSCPNLLAFESASAQAIKLHRIDPVRFPLPLFSNEETSSPPGADDPTLSVRVGRAGTTLQLAPRVEFQDKQAFPLMDTTVPVQEVADNAEVLSLAETARQAVADPAFVARVAAEERGLPNRDAEVITLGTGSALPSKYRNVSATLVRVPGYGNYLFDCGENTLGQMRRVFGPDGADEVLRSLRVIYISHNHADHHLGTVSVLQRWRQVVNSDNNNDSADTTSEKKKNNGLAVIGSPNFLSFLHEYRDVEDIGFEQLALVSIGKMVRGSLLPETRAEVLFEQAFRTLRNKSRSRNRSMSRTEAEDNIDSDSENNNSSSSSASSSTRSELERRFGLADVQACYVDHCHSATAAVLSWPSGLRVAYSGDCRPSREFARMARGADLLVHEATFDDNLAGEALAKKHSTVSEALAVARDMRARRVLLTHFSQRYPKIPVIPTLVPSTQEAEAEAGAETEVGDGERDSDTVPVLFAFDGMRVRLGDFREAEAFIPALRKLYEEEETEREAAA